MSNAVFPALPGLEPVRPRIPRFRTRISESVSGIEARLGFMQYPTWMVTLSFEFLRHNVTNNELNKILAFFLNRGGARDSFLYTDPEDNAVVDFQFGTGDWSTVAFQLLRAFDATGVGGSSFVEPVENVNAITNIKKAGVAMANPADYTINSTGLVTFAVAPAAAAPLTWTGSYYWRMRFEEDEIETERFMYQLFRAKKVGMRGSVMNKILP